MRAPESDPVKLPFLSWLWFYRNAISPLDGPRCAMWPTCSRYATEAVAKHGPLFGGFLAADRLIHEGSAREPEYEVIEKFGRRYIHDPVERNDRMFRRASRPAAREVAIADGREGESYALGALADAALARETAKRFESEGRGWEAITELRRAAYLSPDRTQAAADLADAGWLAIRAGARLEGARREDAFEDADAAFDDARKEAVLVRDEALVFRAEYGRAFASLSRGYTTEAARRFEILAEKDREAAWLAAWARFSLAVRDGESPKEAAVLFRPFLDDAERGVLARDAIEFAQDERAGRRSPQAAAMLNMLLPGLGYAYAGRPLIGAGSFVLNGLFIGATVLAIREGNYPLAAILLSMETGWYFGGAAGAAQSALERNHLRTKRVEKRMRKRFLGAVGPNGAAAVLLF